MHPDISATLFFNKDAQKNQQGQDSFSPSGPRTATITTKGRTLYYVQKLYKDLKIRGEKFEKLSEETKG